MNAIIGVDSNAVHQQIWERVKAVGWEGVETAFNRLCENVSRKVQKVTDQTGLISGQSDVLDAK